MQLPIQLKGICFIYSLTIKEIVQTGMNNFDAALFTLAGNLQKILKTETPLENFDYIIASCIAEESKRQVFQNFFSIFTKQPAKILTGYPGILIGPLEEKRIITRELYADFKTGLKASYRLDTIKDQNPADQRTRQILEKIRSSQEIIKQIKKAKNQEEEEINFPSLISSLIYKFGSSQTVGKFSYYVFYDQIERMQAYQNYDITLRSKLAGAKIPKQKMTSWLRELN